ncbi:MAG: DUF5615 family PIN-like protein [Dehalococcoidia bacterium]
MAAFQILLDENLSPVYRRELLRHAPDMTIWRVGDPGTPPSGTEDPVILKWCEASGFVLVTSNRHSMPGHLREHLANGGHVPGILSFTQDTPIGLAIEHVLIVAIAGRDDDVRDQIVYLPLS